MPSPSVGAPTVSGVEFATAAFNSDLYVVGATVIPVLFIALLVPEGLLARYAVWVKHLRSLQLARIQLRLARKALREADQAELTEAVVPGPSAFAVWGVFRLYDLLVFPVTAALILFVMGEISAAHALNHRRASGTEHWWVETALVGLPLLAVASVIASNSFRWASGISHRADSSAARPAREATECSDLGSKQSAA